MWSSQARTSHFMSITSWSVGQMTLHTLLALWVLPLMQEEVSSLAILPSTPFQHNSPSITIDRPIVRVREHFSLVYIIHSEGYAHTQRQIAQSVVRNGTKTQNSNFRLHVFSILFLHTDLLPDIHS